MVRNFGGLLTAAVLCAGCAANTQPPVAASAEPQTVSDPGAMAPPAAFPANADGFAPGSGTPAPAEPAPPPEAPPAPAAEKPMQSDGGRYRVSVASERTAEMAAASAQKFEAAGYRVTTETADVGGTTWHRVVLPGYSRDGAHAIIPILAQEGTANAWIVPRAGTPAAPPAPPAEAAAAPPPPPPPPAEAQPQN